MGALNVEVAVVPCSIHEQKGDSEAEEPKEALKDRTEYGRPLCWLLIQDIARQRFMRSEVDLVPVRCQQTEMRSLFNGLEEHHSPPRKRMRATMRVYAAVIGWFGSG